MQAVIDDVITKFGLKQPTPGSQSHTVRDEAERFAVQLLEKYKNHLTERSFTSSHDKD